MRVIGVPATLLVRRSRSARLRCPWACPSGGRARVEKSEMADASHERTRVHFWPCLRGSEVNALPRAWHPLTRRGRASCNVRDTVQRARHSEMLRAVRERAGAAHRGPETTESGSKFHIWACLAVSDLAAARLTHRAQRRGALGGRERGLGRRLVLWVVLVGRHGRGREHGEHGNCQSATHAGRHATYAGVCEGSEVFTGASRKKRLRKRCAPRGVDARVRELRGARGKQNGDPTLFLAHQFQMQFGTVWQFGGFLQYTDLAPSRPPLPFLTVPTTH